MLIKPTYLHKPIGSIESLAKSLGLSKEDLIELASNSNEYFFIAKKVEKPDKSIRLTYDVKPRLKQIHEKICCNLLKKVNYPDYIQGGVRGKSYLSNCQNHTHKKIVIKEDVSNFFPSISKKIIHEVWAGFFHFPSDVSELLSELVTFNGYLVQGGKASGFLCNLVLYDRESKLVEEFSKKGFKYTRFVDDITISCLRNITKDEQTYIIRKTYGLLKSIEVNPNKRKHKIMSNGVQQQLHGVNLNTNKPTLPKAERKKIEAAVFQCEKAHSENSNSIQYIKQFNSAMGRVNTMKRMHPKAGQALLERLCKIKPQINSRTFEQKHRLEIFRNLVN
ncbi:reverse transcriptase family protein [Methylomonas methanica]|uniref:Retron reverse transcriptase n=1 Tax=Methylomonas methanica (strain DSM 25384 / MC09) TaxID=857087 RepID=G0A4K9_METMM|nr:reverse transcriptase family protein [Methylomonas methanica]AEG01600.1 retron reverse transcriptase [Methylomonas methanica MC09]